MFTSFAVLRVSSQEKTVDELKRAIGLDASRYVEGRWGEGVTPRDTRWILESNLPETADVAEHVEYFLSILEDDEYGFSSLSPDEEKDIWCTITIVDGQAGFDLSAPLMKRLVGQSVSLIFGLYPGDEQSG